MKTFTVFIYCADFQCTWSLTERSKVNKNKQDVKSVPQYIKKPKCMVYCVNMIYRLQDVGSINNNTKGATSEAGTPEFTMVGLVLTNL